MDEHESRPASEAAKGMIVSTASWISVFTQDERKIGKRHLVPASMTRHSKNNTASSVFSKAEYDKLAAHYGTQRARLGADSHRNFDACSLCLSAAVSPVSCTKGHLYCKECVMKDLLAQREALARKKQEIEALRKEEEDEKERVRIQARERVLNGGTASLFGKRKERDERKDGQCPTLFPHTASHIPLKTTKNLPAKRESLNLMQMLRRNWLKKPKTKQYGS